MKYLLSYMTMFNAMIITLMLGAGFTTVLGISMFALIFKFVLLGEMAKCN